MPANGVILLGYARSAGSGDQPVAGLVTSRRDRGALEKKKLIKAVAAEEDRKVRQRQEVAAQYLKRKWKEQDDKKKRRAERPGHRDDVDDVRKAPAASESSDEEEATGAPQSQPAVAEGKWVSKDDVNNRVTVQAREHPRSDARASIAGAKEPERRGPLPGGPKPVTMDPVVQQKRKKALASAFGLDDDDDGEARRELELAARIKRQRVGGGDPGAGSGMLSSAPPPAATKPAMDMYDQLRKLAEWKRKCKGNRIPMPDDLVAAIGATAGVQHSGQQQTLGTDPVTAARRRARSPSRSRSRSGGGNRRFAEKKRSRSRSRKASRRSRSRRRDSEPTRTVL